jgi:hypothetical protein
MSWQREPWRDRLRQGLRDGLRQGLFHAALFVVVTVLTILAVLRWPLLAESLNRWGLGP